MITQLPAYKSIVNSYMIGWLGRPRRTSPVRIPASLENQDPAEPKVAKRRGEVRRLISAEKVSAVDPAKVGVGVGVGVGVETNGFFGLRQFRSLRMSLKGKITNLVFLRVLRFPMSPHMEVLSSFFYSQALAKLFVVVTCK